METTATTSLDLSAETSYSLETVVQDLCVSYDLNESNFSFCYYNTVTGEYCTYNPDAWMIAGSTYKLPLNMYYYELQNEGILSSNTIIAGYTLQDIHYESIVNSNNELSEALIYNLGSYQDYKEIIFSQYGELETEEISDLAWSSNYFTTRYMINTLQYLYDSSDQFTQMLDFMCLANPDSYFHKYVFDFDIAHKYGAYDTAENDVGIVYTDEPYLLAVYTYGLDDGETVVGRINEAICDYNLEHIQTFTATAAEGTAAESATASDTAPVTAGFASSTSEGQGAELTQEESSVSDSSDSASSESAAENMQETEALVLETEALAVSHVSSGTILCTFVVFLLLAVILGITAGIRHWFLD